ncbi:cyclopropane mycolic acid synthase family methyltransferase [Mycobacteroides salmoniphilum]|uniref:cyclopropane mycolic acid synthase family methyltransferase n=1 Tax=Mycobacteroides salmoniphilum TaxID=404941 RepID=UPI0010652D2D|nr:cyclopropane mycolic acid synthase family methyltransferase [Mycobacteroides salmoniphilum]TDZ76898.1 Cyclopropane mycolic acid synthase 1 [Mycobacteroides salmoniphilum]TDZ86601.1 Cyclopropane mycolic acid synthase 1 [Mycobacteroides salmoniphilum]
MPKFIPKFDEIQAHYDLSDDFFALFLDPSRTYSCAFFEPDDLTLEQAQRAKVDLALGKLNLQPGMTLLDVGCGWGSTLLRALEHYDVNVIGLTLSKNQHAHVTQLLQASPSSRSKQVLLHGWEEFDGKVDRIVSIGAFEHFGHERYPAFFEFAYDALPDDGIMLLHTIVSFHPDELRRRGVALTFERARFAKFMLTEIFPGGRLPSNDMVGERASEAGFTLTRQQSLQMHYAKTLDYWLKALQDNKDQAIAIQDEVVYERYVKYLSGCAPAFRDGFVDVTQFTLEK